MFLYFANVWTVRETCYLSTAPNACSSTYKKDNYGDAVVVCGSPGEVSNDPLAKNVFATLGKLSNVLFTDFSFKIFSHSYLHHKQVISVLPRLTRNEMLG